MIRKVGSVDGASVYEATLQVENQRVVILNYGCIVRRWQFLGHAAGSAERPRDLVLGFDSVNDYQEGAQYFGTVVGRVANRTCLGRFRLNGDSYQLSINNGEHHLHGGSRGLGQRVWSMEADSAQQQVRLTYESPAGEEGYPGGVTFEVFYRLTSAGLQCDMRAMPDIPTPINLAQHNYYNLNGFGDVLDHTLLVAADRYLPVDDALIPLGMEKGVDGTRFDFRQPVAIGAADPQRLGVDHNLALRKNQDAALPAATLYSGDRRIKLDVFTDQPGIQVYTAAQMSIPNAGKEGRKYGPYAGVCLEAQGFPDALNNPDFPSIICTPDKPYRQMLNLHLSGS